MRNLIYRVITVIFLLPVILAVFILGGYYLSALLMLASLLACLEISGIILPKNKRAKFLTLIFWAGFFLPVVFSVNLTFLAFIVPAIFIINGIILFLSSIDVKEHEKITAVFFWSLYAMLGIACVYWLVNSEALLHKRVGLSFIFLACIATWSNDSFAYIFGRLFGKTPLFKSVSQKKTWEGFFFGALFSLISVFLFKYGPLLFGFDWLYGLNLKDLLWVSLPAILFAPMGDLIESRLKRFYDTKDSSQILPGHGGLLDRIDALLMVMLWTALYAFIIRPVW